jgi:6-phosphogluconate dehydrogenase (decarboxylating)
MVKEKPWLEVDYEKVIESGKFVLTIKSKASIKALKNIVEYGYMELVKEGLDYISSVNPALLARSERSKYALAYMVAVKIKTGELPTRESVLKVFNISNTSYNRLRNIVEKILREASVIQSQ